MRIDLGVATGFEISVRHFRLSIEPTVCTFLVATVTGIIWYGLNVRSSTRRRLKHGVVQPNMPIDRIDNVPLRCMLGILVPIYLAIKYIQNKINRFLFVVIFTFTCVKYCFSLRLGPRYDNVLFKVFVIEILTFLLFPVPLSPK